MNKLKQLNFLFKKPKLVIVTGNGRSCASEAVFQVLKKHFKVRKIIGDDLPWVSRKEVLIFETKLGDYKIFESLVKKSQKSLLIVSHLGEYHPDKEFFAGELSQVAEIAKLAQILPIYSHLILNFDDETVRDIKSVSSAHPLTFGFGKSANIQVSDVVLTQDPSFGTNFKINYGGKIVPVWLENLFGKEQIYSALAAVTSGLLLDLNLVEISEGLKLYQSLPGKMRLIKGIKHTFLLDNSASPSAFSMVEALEILGKIKSNGRKIAVLGDVLGIGKYTIEAHEAIGERVVKSSDMLFTIGARAKFIAQGALSRNMDVAKIFQYDIIDSVKKALQKKLEKGDFVLFSGIKEEMKEIIEEVVVE